jgi:hypothetical protein
MVPFDRAPYTQSLFNPHPKRADELITVQYCKQQVRPYSNISTGPAITSTSQIEEQLCFKCGKDECHATEIDPADALRTLKKVQQACVQCQ